MSVRTLYSLPPALRVSNMESASMHSTPDRQQLIELVRKISQATGSEAEINNWITLVENSVPHPAVSDLIFHPSEEMTPEEVVDKALSYRPIQL